MDQNDDFEMKPLTAGLGFQKRHVSLKEHLAKTGLAAQNMRKSLPIKPPNEMTGESKPRSAKEIIDELHAALQPVQKNKNKESIKLTEILPRDRNEIKVPTQPLGEVTQIDKVNFQIPDKSITDSVGTRRGANDNLVRSLVPVAVSFASIFLDAFIVLAISLIFLVSLVMVTGVDLISILRSSQSEFATQLSLVVLYVAVYKMYVIIARSFFGFTIAEWTFELQMGSDDQIQKSSYPILVLWRSSLILITGILVMPILSLLFNKDIAARFTGLQLFKKNI